MRNLFIPSFILVLLVSFGCSREIGYHVEGTAPDGASQIVLSKLVGKNPVPIDTVDVLADGNIFRFDGKIDIPCMAYLSTLEANHTFSQFFLTNEVFNVIHEENTSNYDVEGGTENEFYKSFCEGYMSYLKNHPDSIFNYMDSVITCNPESFSLSYFLFRQLYHELAVDELELLADKFSPDVQSCSYIAILRKLIKQTRLSQPGCKYIDFVSNDFDGKRFNFSSMFDGKSWILLDFWASWCPYCREENPSLVKLYSIYHDKGLNILSVSLDTDYTEWMKAVEHDSLGWKHVSNLDRWECEAARNYGISGIPGNILFSPDGTIVSRNLHGEELENFIQTKLDN